jgi:hypothetical protein
MCRVQRKQHCMCGRAAETAEGEGHGPRSSITVLRSLDRHEHLAFSTCALSRPARYCLLSFSICHTASFFLPAVSRGPPSNCRGSRFLVAFVSPSPSPCDTAPFSCSTFFADSRSEARRTPRAVGTVNQSHFPSGPLFPIAMASSSRRDTPSTYPRVSEMRASAGPASSDRRSSSEMNPWGQTRCYWTVNDADLRFRYCDPVLSSHLKEVR